MLDSCKMVEKQSEACIHIYVYICVYVCMYESIDICVDGDAFVPFLTGVHKHTRSISHAHTQIHIFIYVPILIFIDKACSISLLYIYIFIERERNVDFCIGEGVLLINKIYFILTRGRCSWCNNYRHRKWTR